MSDRIDTDAVRRDLRAGEHRGMRTILALCDEVDRLRTALLVVVVGVLVQGFIERASPFVVWGAFAAGINLGGGPYINDGWPWQRGEGKP